MFIPESITDNCIMVYIVLKYFCKVTLKSKGRLVPVIFIQQSLILFFAMASAMSAHCCKDSTCILTSDRLNFLAGLLDFSLLLARQR